MDEKNNSFYNLTRMPYWGNCMEEAMGVTFLPFDAERNQIKAELTVDHRTCQPFGRINGGASLALAEMLAGHGSFYLCQPDERPVGIQVSGNHVGWAAVGTKVIATATLEHKGQTTHVWNVTIRTEDGHDVCMARVTNMVLKEPA